jgi:hypothetical protein
MARVQGFNKRAPRIDLRQPAVMVASDGSAWDVIILDVSSGGFRLEVPESPRIGEFVTLHVGRDEHYEAQVRWALGDQAGGVFLTAVGIDEWQDGESAMDANQTGDGDRRTGDDRREEERRQDGDRREPGGAGAAAGDGDKRKGERRGGNRRQGDRRG